MISFIDEHRSRLGVEPICRPLPIAPSTCYEGFAKRTDVDRLSARARNDIAMKNEICQGVQRELPGLWRAQGLASVTTGRL